MGGYHIIGMRGAGSLIVEFLLSEVAQEYDIDFITRADLGTPEFRTINPLAKIPVLTCPDGTRIFETTAMVMHLTEAFPSLAPPVGSRQRALHWQHLAMLATAVYPAYHRQHNSLFYVDESAHDDMRQRARDEQAVIFDFIEETLDPYLCGAEPMAADYYLYMLLRWDLDKTALREGRPKLTSFIDTMRHRPSVDKVISMQRKR